MKIITAALILAGFAGPACAAVRQPVLDAPQYTCARTALSHVALAAPPAPCCVGHLNCPQLLSNTGLAKPKRDNRT